MITIIDYKSGNLKSISNGFKKIGAEYQITDDKQIIADSDYLVLQVLEHSEAQWIILKTLRMLFMSM